VDVETLHITVIYCTTTKKHDAKIEPQVTRRNAADLRSLEQIVVMIRKPSETNSVETVFVP